jgi:hypothetical protein
MAASPAKRTEKEQENNIIGINIVGIESRRMRNRGIAIETAGANNNADPNKNFSHSAAILVSASPLLESKNFETTSCRSQMGGKKLFCVANT